MTFVFRHGDVRTGCPQPRRAPALVAVMVSVENPFEPVDSHLTESFGDRARAGVDDEPAVAIDEEVDVAGIAQAEEVLGDPLQRRRFGDAGLARRSHWPRREYALMRPPSTVSAVPVIQCAS